MILGPFVVWHLSISPYSGPTESPNQAYNWVTIFDLRVKSQTVITTMAEISISIENKYFWGEHKVITLKQQFLGIILCFLMY